MPEQPNFNAGDHTGESAPDQTTDQDVNPQTTSPEGGEGSDHSFIEYNGRKLSKEEVLNKLQHADTFIDTLKGERETDRERLERLEKQAEDAKKVSDVLAALQGGDTAQPDGGNDTSSEGDDAADPSAIADQVLRQLQEKEAQKRQEENWNSVTKTLTATFGDKTNEKVREVALANDMTVEEAASMAKSKPKVFLRLFDLKGGETSTPVNTGSGRRPSLADQDDGPSGYSEAKSTKEQVDILHRAYRKHGLID